MNTLGTNILVMLVFVTNKTNISFGHPRNKKTFAFIINDSKKLRKNKKLELGTNKSGPRAKYNGLEFL